MVLAHGVQADVADGMILSAGWLLHDEHPLTVPCAHQHSSMSCHRPQSHSARNNYSYTRNRATGAQGGAVAHMRVS